VLARFEDVFAQGLRELIDRDGSLELVASDVEQRRVSVVLRAHRPDVAILDAGALSDGVEVRELSERHTGTRLVLLAKEPSRSLCASLLAFGASACLGRDTQARDVLSAIHLAARGLQVTPRGAWASDDALPGAQLLTPREADVLLMLQQGRSNAEIALGLYVGIETVRTHAHNVYVKLGVSSRRELLDAARPDRVSAARAARPLRCGSAPHRSRASRPGTGAPS
jgi:two-component system nitrate/nitrite response regulator NarL